MRELSFYFNRQFAFSTHFPQFIALHTHPPAPLAACPPAREGVKSEARRRGNDGSLSLSLSLSLSFSP